MAKVPVEQFHGEVQHGSFSTPSADLHSSRDSCRIPGAADIKRLLKAKAAHEQRVKVVQARVQILKSQEQQIWKDVKLLQQRGHHQAEFAQWQREVRKEEQLQFQRDVADYHEALKERARHVRASLQNTQDSRRLLAALHEVREQSHQSKLMQVEVRRQQRKQQQLRKQVEATRQEQLRQEWNSMRYAQLQEEMQQAEQELAAIEQQEIAALSRLQRSQSVRESVVSQYHTEVAPRPASMAEMSTAASTREPLEEPPKLAGDLLEVERYVDDRNGLKETQEMPAQKRRSHQRSGSSGFAPVDLELEEFPQSEPMPAMELPVEGEGDPSPRKREGVRPKQPRGYAFSPKTRRASAGPSQAKQAD